MGGWKSRTKDHQHWDGTLGAAKLTSNTGTIQHVPTNPKDIVNKEYVDDNAGGVDWEIDQSPKVIHAANYVDNDTQLSEADITTMGFTKDVSLWTDSGTDAYLNTARRIDMNFQQITNMAAPTAAAHATTKAYVDGKDLWEVDGTETQLKVADEIDMQAYRIINSALCVSDNDLTRKSYVDGKDTAQTSARVMTKVLIDTYTGNGAANREIDLGDDYDEVHIYLDTSKQYDVLHLAHAYAIRTTYGAENHQYHRSGASANLIFQGKMTGADANKIKLGTGATDESTNRNTWVYRIIARKYANVESLP